MIKAAHVRIEAHAAQRMIERGVTTAEVIKAMNDGDVIDRPTPPRFRFHARLWMAKDNDWLHAIWAIERPKLVVVTIFRENPKTRRGR